jgi:pyruvate/2-oxoglutarate dehydrogenase complex dihydrolipoamide acyltransferase (E2) component
LQQTIQQNGITIEALVKEVGELKAQQNQSILTIQTEQEDMEEVANEKANPTEQQQQEEQQQKEELEANFGNNPANPFKYDIQTCPGLVFN